MNKILSKSKSLIALILAAVLVFGDLPATGALGLGAIDASAEETTPADPYALEVALDENIDIDQTAAVVTMGSTLSGMDALTAGVPVTTDNTVTATGDSGAEIEAFGLYVVTPPSPASATDDSTGADRVADLVTDYSEKQVAYINAKADYIGALNDYNTALEAYNTVVSSKQEDVDAALEAKNAAETAYNTAEATYKTAIADETALEYSDYATAYATYTTAIANEDANIDAARATLNTAVGDCITALETAIGNETNPDTVAELTDQKTALQAIIAAASDLNTKASDYTSAETDYNNAVTDLEAVDDAALAAAKVALDGTEEADGATATLNDAYTDFVEAKAAVDALLGATPVEVTKQTLTSAIGLTYAWTTSSVDNRTITFTGTPIKCTSEDGLNYMVVAYDENGNAGYAPVYLNTTSYTIVPGVDNNALELSYSETKNVTATIKVGEETNTTVSSGVTVEAKDADGNSYTGIYVNTSDITYDDGVATIPVTGLKNGTSKFLIKYPGAEDVEITVTVSAANPDYTENEDLVISPGVSDSYGGAGKIFKIVPVVDGNIDYTSDAETSVFMDKGTNGFKNAFKFTLEKTWTSGNIEPSASPDVSKDATVYALITITEDNTDSNIILPATYSSDSWTVDISEYKTRLKVSDGIKLFVDDPVEITVNGVDTATSLASATYNEYKAVNGKYVPVGVAKTKSSKKYIGKGSYLGLTIVANTDYAITPVSVSAKETADTKDVSLRNITAATKANADAYGCAEGEYMIGASKTADASPSAGFTKAYTVSAKGYGVLDATDLKITMNGTDVSTTGINITKKAPYTAEPVAVTVAFDDEDLEDYVKAEDIDITVTTDNIGLTITNAQKTDSEGKKVADTYVTSMPLANNLTFTYPADLSVNDGRTATIHLAHPYFGSTGIDIGVNLVITDQDTDAGLLVFTDDELENVYGSTMNFGTVNQLPASNPATNKTDVYLGVITKDKEVSAAALHDGLEVGLYKDATGSEAVDADDETFILTKDSKATAQNSAISNTTSSWYKYTVDLNESSEASAYAGYYLVAKLNGETIQAIELKATVKAADLSTKVSVNTDADWKTNGVTVELPNIKAGGSTSETITIDVEDPWGDSAADVSTTLKAGIYTDDSTSSAVSSDFVLDSNSVAELIKTKADTDTGAAAVDKPAVYTVKPATTLKKGNYKAYLIIENTGASEVLEKPIIVTLKVSVAEADSYNVQIEYDKNDSDTVRLTQTAGSNIGKLVNGAGITLTSYVESADGSARDAEIDDYITIYNNSNVDLKDAENNTLSVYVSDESGAALDSISDEDEKAKLNVITLADGPDGTNADVVRTVTSLTAGDYQWFNIIPTGDALTTKGEYSTYITVQYGATSPKAQVIIPVKWVVYASAVAKKDGNKDLITVTSDPAAKDIKTTDASGKETTEKDIIVIPDGVEGKYSSKKDGANKATLTVENLNTAVTDAVSGLVATATGDVRVYAPKSTSHSEATAAINLPASSKAEFVIVPKPGLTKGVYTGKVTLSTANVTDGATLGTYNYKFTVTESKTLDLTAGFVDDTIADGYAERLYNTLANPAAKDAAKVVSIGGLTGSSAEAILNLNGSADLKENEGNVKITFTLSGGKATKAVITKTGEATAATASIGSTAENAFTTVNFKLYSAVKFNLNTYNEEINLNGVTSSKQFSALVSAGSLIPTTKSRVEDQWSYYTFDESTKNIFAKYAINEETSAPVTDPGTLAMTVYVPAGDTIAKTLGVTSLNGVKENGYFLNWVQLDKDGKEVKKDGANVVTAITDKITADLSLLAKFHDHKYPAPSAITDDMWKWVGPFDDGTYKATLTLECIDEDCPNKSASKLVITGYSDAVNPGPNNKCDEINYHTYKVSVDPELGGNTTAYTYTTSKRIDDKQKNGHTWKYTVTWKNTSKANEDEVWVPTVVATCLNCSAAKYTYKADEVEVVDKPGNVTSNIAGGKVVAQFYKLDKNWQAGGAVKFTDTYAEVNDDFVSGSANEREHAVKAYASSNPQITYFTAGTVNADSTVDLATSTIKITFEDNPNEIEVGDADTNTTKVSIVKNAGAPTSYNISYTYMGKTYTEQNVYEHTTHDYSKPQWSNWTKNATTGEWETYLTLSDANSNTTFTTKAIADPGAPVNGYYTWTASAIVGGTTYNKSKYDDVLITDLNFKRVDPEDKDHSSHNYTVRGWNWEAWNYNADHTAGIIVELECDHGEKIKVSDGLKYVGTEIAGPETGVSIEVVETPKGTGSIYTATLTLSSAFTGGKKLTFTDYREGVRSDELGIISAADGDDYISYDIGQDVDTIVYTGKKVTLDNLKVYWNESLLVQGTDYTVKYANNTNAGTATATITGKGQYTFTQPVQYTIQKADIADATVGQVTVAMGAKKVSNPSVKYLGKSLKINKDFVISDASEWTSAKEGNFFVEITGTGTNFEGTAYAQLVVYNKANSIPASKLTVKVAPASLVALTKDEAANGRNIAYTVSYGKTTIATCDAEGNFTYASDDYNGTLSVVSGDVANNAGANNLVIDVVDELKVPSGKTTKTVIGTKTQKYTIKSVKFAKTEFAALNKTSVPYTGEAYTFASLLDTLNMDIDTLSSLTYEDDYTVALTKNVKKGTMKVTFNGLGMYAGSKVTKSVKITATGDLRVYINGGQYVTGDVYEIPYTKGGSKFASGDVEVKALDDDFVLREGVDYTLSYKKNKKVGQAGTMTIKGKGNYGSFTVNFVVIPNEDPIVRVATAEVVSGKEAKALAKAPVVYDVITGKKLTANKDFTYTYATTPVDGNYYVSLNFNAGTDGNYKGYANVDAYENPLTGVHVYGTKINAKMFTQKTVKYQGTPINIQASEDYFSAFPKDKLGEPSFIIVSVKNNIKAGKATVVVKGTGSYGGTATIKYTISKSTGK